jgi:hypothetical protein
VSSHPRDAEDHSSSSQVSDIADDPFVVIANTKLKLDGLSDGCIAGPAVEGTNTAEIAERDSDKEVRNGLVNEGDISSWIIQGFGRKHSRIVLIDS